MSLEQELNQSWKQYDSYSRDETDFSGRTAICKNNGDEEKRYKIEKKVGEGQFGIVYKCTDETGKSVALKLLKYTGPELINLAKKESKILSSIDNENIVKHKGFFAETYIEGVKDSIPAIAMEYVEGKTLDVADVGANFSKYVINIMEGLGAAHACGVLHRDVKPGNFIITPDGQLKITDFGVSKFIKTDNADCSMTQCASEKGNIAGTLKYMPRSQEEMENPGQDTDVYSLGLVLNQIILSNPNAEIDAWSERRLLKAAEEKKLPNPKKLAELVCGMTLNREERSPNSIEAIRETDVYKKMEDIAGVPVYWKKFSGLAEQFFSLEGREEIHKHLALLEKDKRIEGAMELINMGNHLRSRGIVGDNYVNSLNMIIDFFNLQESKIGWTGKGYPKNKEDAELEIQAIKYCLKNNAVTEIKNLAEWEKRINKYQSEFGINAKEELGILNNVLSEKQEKMFDQFIEEAKTKIHDSFQGAKYLDNIETIGLTSDQIHKLRDLIYEKVGALNQKEEEYRSLIKRLEGKQVTSEFKEAFAMAAYKDGICPENINKLLTSLEDSRHKSLAERTKNWFYQKRRDFYPRDKAKSQLARINTNLEADADSIDKIIAKAVKISKRNNVFIGDLIEDGILDYAKFRLPACGYINHFTMYFERHPATIAEQATNYFEREAERVAGLAHKYNVCIKQVLDTAITGIVKEILDKARKVTPYYCPGNLKIITCFEDLNKKYPLPDDAVQEIKEFFKDIKFTEENGAEIIQSLNSVQYKNNQKKVLQQKYPNAFKESPKFEDLEGMIEKENNYKIYDAALFKGAPMGAILLGGAAYALSGDLSNAVIYSVLGAGLGAFVGGIAKSISEDIKAEKETLKKISEKSEPDNTAAEESDRIIVNRKEYEELPNKALRLINTESIKETSIQSQTETPIEVPVVKAALEPDSRPELHITEPVQEPYQETEEDDNKVMYE